MQAAIYYIDQFKWPVTIIIVAIYLRHLWRKAGKEIEKERKEAQRRFMEKMSCKKCGGMMSLGSMKYCLRCEPYVIHRRPPNTQGIHRTFVRISFTPIEIMDINNTENPAIQTNYTRDGIKDYG